MWSKPATTCSTAYPAHPLISIFSGSVLFISARRQIRYCQRHSNRENTPYRHPADSATGYTNCQGNFSRSCLLTGSKRLRPHYLFSTRVSKIGRWSFDVTNSRRRRCTANRRRARLAWLSGHIAERDSVAAEFNFTVSNDITKTRSGIDPNSVGNCEPNYMTARFCKIFNNLSDLLTYKIIFDGLPSEPSNSCLQKPSNLPEIGRAHV